MAGSKWPQRWLGLKPPVGTPLDRAQPLAQGLLAYWPMTEAGGGTLYDYGPSASAGVFQSPGPSWGVHQYGPQVIFSASNQNALAPSRAAFQASPPLSVALWVRFTQTSNQIFVEINGNSGWSIQCNNNGKFWINMGGVIAAQSTTQSKSAWNDNKWHLMVYTVSGTGSGTATLYVDGGDDTDTTQHNASAPTYAGAQVVFGARPGVGGSYTGQMHSVWYWNRVLTAHEAGQLSQNPLCLYAPARRVWVMPRTQGIALAAATLSPLGGLGRTPSHVSAGSSTPTGAIARTPAHHEAGASTPAGTIARTPAHQEAGSSTAAGTFTRTPGHQEAGAARATGSLARAPAHQESGSSTPAGALGRTPLAGLSGALAAGAGRLGRSIAATGDAALASSGALGRALCVGGTYDATLAATGDLARTLSTALATATLAATGALGNVARVARDAALDLAGAFAGGALHRLYTLFLDASLDLAGVLAKAPVRHDAGTLAPAGGLMRTAALVREGTVALRGRYVGIFRVVRRAALALAARAARLLAPLRVHRVGLLSRLHAVAPLAPARPTAIALPARARTLRLSPERTVPMQLVALDPDAPLVIAPLERNIAFTADFSADIPSGRQIASVATQVVRLDDPTQTDLSDDFVATSTLTSGHTGVEVIVGNGAQQARATYRVRIIATLDNSPATDLVGYFDLPCRE